MLDYNKLNKDIDAILESFTKEDLRIWLALKLEKEIREAYIFLREKNMSIPSETLQFMLDASLEKLEQIDWSFDREL